MKLVAIVALTACSSAAPEPAKSVASRDAAPRMTDPHPPATYTTPPTAACGEPGATTPPQKVVQLTGGGESCARLVDGTVWCWGARGQTLIRSDATSSLACAVATRIPNYGVADHLWASPYRTTCVAAKGSVRCGVLADWGFEPTATPLDARVGFQWSGLPCAITRDNKIRCLRDDKTKEAAILGPVEEVAIENSGFGALCALSRTAVSCLRDGKAEVVASNVMHLAAGEKLWGLRRDGTVVRLDSCNDAGTWKPCSIPIEGIRDAISIASGGPTACAVRRDGRVVCADCVAKTACADPAKPVEGITDATQVAVGIGHVCALRKTGEVMCWGHSECGQAGGTAEAGKVCSEKPIVVPPTTILWAK